MDLKNVKYGDIVRVKGKVVYGDSKYDVDCLGIVVAVNSSNMLINLDEVDGDKKVGCLVKNSYITPLSTLEVLKAIISEEFDTEEEYLEFLSDEFADELENTEDAQEAFNNLDDKYFNYLSHLGCVYSLFDGESWSIEPNPDVEESEILKHIQEFQDEYQYFTLKTVEDIASALDSHVRDTMSNVGCDVYTALRLELDEISEEVSEMFIVYSDGEEIPKIEIL